LFGAATHPQRKTRFHQKANDWTLAALLAAVKKGPADLQLLACAWQGKTPVNSFLRNARKEPVVRPAVSCSPATNHGEAALLGRSSNPGIHRPIGNVSTTEMSPATRAGAQREQTWKNCTPTCAEFKPRPSPLPTCDRGGNPVTYS
jgi:hypothetical protein